MRYILLILLILCPNLVASTGSSDSRHVLTTIEKIHRLNTLLPTKQAPMIARAIDAASRKYNISPDIFVSIIKTESNFNQAAVSVSGDISIAQINVKVWNKEFKRMKLSLIDAKKLKKSPVYAINVMGRILTIMHDRYSKKDTRWFARYHSNTQKHKLEYLSKLRIHSRMFASIGNPNIIK